MIQLSFAYTTHGKPIIVIDKRTQIIFSTSAPNGLPPWESLMISGVASSSYKGNTIYEEVRERCMVRNITFKRRTKGCVNPDVLKHIVAIIKKYVNERGVITASSMESLEKEILIPFEASAKPKHKPAKREFDEDGNPIKKKRGRPKKS